MISGGYKHYIRMCRRGYLQASERTPLATPDTTLLMVQVKSGLGPFTWKSYERQASSLTIVVGCYRI